MLSEVPEYPTDTQDVERTSIHDAAELALAGMITADRPFYAELRGKAITGLVSVWTTHRGTPLADRARAVALSLGGDRQRFGGPRVSGVVSGGLPGLGRRS